MRPFGSTAFWLSLVALVGAVVLGGSARASLALQEGTPAAATPAAPAGTTDVVTLITWYSNDPSGDFISIVPLQTDPGNVAGPATGAAPIGRSEFPEGGLPFVTIGDTRFEAYLRFEGDIAERWSWFDETEGSRPATLVMQVSGIGGPYDGYFGTATFVSRDDGAGGVLILALRPPTPAAEPEAAAEPAAEEGAAADAPADEAAEVPVATVAPGTELGGDEDVAGDEDPPTEEGGEVVVATVEPPTELGGDEDLAGDEEPEEETGTDEPAA